MKTMNPDWLLSHFNEISETPDAVPRLRRFILDLAVRGKLVEQDPQDKPASKLLERIQAEKARLVKEGILRMPSPVAPIDQTECPFDIPGTWQWIRLAEAGSIIGGGTPPSKDSECFTEGGKGIAWLTPADLGKHKSLLISHGERDLTKKGLASSSAQLMPAGSVLFTSRAPIGYTAIAENDISTNQGFKSVVPFIMDFNRYIAVYFKAFASWIDGKASGTTFKEVSGKIVANLPFPLPPLHEQHRIVAKVDELMALCDELEAAQQKRERRRDRLVAATLNGLNNGDGRSETHKGSEFEESARFYFSHLPRLTTRPEHIQQLRQTILTLAVRGQLVPQDPNDEPAEELMKIVEHEKFMLIQRGLLKRQQPLSPISISEEVFGIHCSWKWVKIGDLAVSIDYGTSQKSENINDGVPILKMGDIQSGRVHLSLRQKVRRDIDDLPALFLKNFDLLYNRTNSAELVGKTGIYLGENEKYTFASYLIRVRLAIEFTNPHFVNLTMNAPFFRETQVVPHLKQQCGQANVNGTKLKNMLIPLPPLAEQHRIVAKVDELMELCDELESRLSSTTVTRRQLLEATLSEAIAP